MHLRKNRTKKRPKYLLEGNYFWNAGIFVWNVRTITSVMRVYAPGIAQICDRILISILKKKMNQSRSCFRPVKVFLLTMQ